MTVVDGDRLLVLAQPLIIEMAERVMQGVNPLYYEMKKANAEIINNQNIYNGLKLAFTGGRIGGISNDITKIWNSGNITKEALNAVKWLCLETNFTIDYAKTLFKPTRPEHVDKILKEYGRQKVPYFFQYAKDKRYSDNYEDSQCEPINNSTINKIVKTIKTNQNMFRPIKNLSPIDYLLLLKHRHDDYYNEEINKVFDRWNKKYGNNVNLHDEDNTDKNNLKAVARQVKTDLNAIEPDDNKVINSLVVFLYKKPSTRKKKLFWYIYGEQLYQNLSENVQQINICRKCGARVDDESYNEERKKCSACIAKENKTGLKELICDDCGEKFSVSIRSRTKRCDKCKIIHRKKQINENASKYYHQNKNFIQCQN